MNLGILFSSELSFWGVHFINQILRSQLGSESYSHVQLRRKEFGTQIQALRSFLAGCLCNVRHAYDKQPPARSQTPSNTQRKIISEEGIHRRNQFLVLSIEQSVQVSGLWCLEWLSVALEMDSAKNAQQQLS